MKRPERLLDSISQRLEAAGHHWDLWLLLALALVTMAAGLGLRSPWPADEPRFALIARDMVETGNWMIPLRGGELYPDKPPVFMWLIALGYRLTGNLNVAFLLPSLVSSLAVLGMVYDLSRRLWGRRIALASGLLLLFSLQFMLQAKTAQIDATVTFWITLGCYGLLRHLLQGPAWGWYFVAWAAMGFGVITKGVGFLPVFLFLPCLFLRWRGTTSVALHRRGRAWLGPLVLIAAVGLWVIPMLLHVAQSGNPAFEVYRDNILLRQTATRYVKALGHVKPFWYYLTSVVPPLWLPLSALLPWLLPRWIADMRRGDARIALLVPWAALVLLFFSLSPGKRGVYILPALPMLCLAAGPYLQEILRGKVVRGLLWGLPLVVGVALTGVSLLGRFELQPLADKAAAYGIDPWGLLLAMGLVSFAACLLFSPRRPLAAWGTFCVCGWLLYSVGGYALLEPVRSPQAMMEAVGRTVGEEGELAIVSFKEQLLLHADRPVVHFGYHTEAEAQQREAAEWLGEAEGRWVLMPQEDAVPCFEPGSLVDLGVQHRRRWVLASREMLSGACEGPSAGVSRYRSPGPPPTDGQSTEATL